MRFRLHTLFHSCLTLEDAAQALLAVKTLGKDPAGSKYLAEAPNLLTLLGFATTFKDDLDASGEALRSIANALLLIEEARSTFISKNVNGGDACILMLEVFFLSSRENTALWFDCFCTKKSTSPDHIFILSRILFLSTASGSTYIETIVEGKYNSRTIVDILGLKLDLMTTAVRNGAPISKEAMSDLLKFIFNILLHYPKVLHRYSHSILMANWSSSWWKLNLRILILLEETRLSAIFGTPNLNRTFFPCLVLVSQALTVRLGYFLLSYVSSIIFRHPRLVQSSHHLPT